MMVVASVVLLVAVAFAAVMVRWQAVEIDELRAERAALQREIAELRIRLWREPR